MNPKIVFNIFIPPPIKKMDIPSDISELPNEVAFKIWSQVLINDKFTYDQALALSKTYRSLTKFLRTDYEYSAVWRHFWEYSYGIHSKLRWDEWLSINEQTGATWTVSWRSFFFWCLLVERTCTRILLELIVDQAHARAEIEFDEPDLFSDDQGWQGPVILLKRERPIIPKRWKYQEAHVSGETLYTFIWPDESEQTYGVDTLMDILIRPVAPFPPI